MIILEKIAEVHLSNYKIIMPLLWTLDVIHDSTAIRPAYGYIYKVART
jgi:hypothetical protein